MENASKALIIAGSILLSILIIALGMYIFSSSSGVTDDTTLSGMEVSTFNGKFEKYKGYQNGTNVSALLDVLISNSNGKNSKAEKPLVFFCGDDDNELYSNGATEKSDLKKIKDKLESSHRYYVEMDTNGSTDLIHAILIEYNKGKSSIDVSVKAGDNSTANTANTANTAK